VAEMLSANGLLYWNLGDQPTYETRMGPSIINVTPASLNVEESISDWVVDVNQVVASDHKLITFRYDFVTSPIEEIDQGVRFQTRKADWEAFRRRLGDRLFDGRFSWLGGDVHLRADYFSSALMEACRASMSKVRSQKLHASVRRLCCRGNRIVMIIGR